MNKLFYVMPLFLYSSIVGLFENNYSYKSILVEGKNSIIPNILLLGFCLYIIFYQVVFVPKRLNKCSKQSIMIYLNSISFKFLILMFLFTIMHYFSHFRILYHVASLCCIFSMISVYWLINSYTIFYNNNK